VPANGLCDFVFKVHAHRPVAVWSEFSRPLTACRSPTGCSPWRLVPAPTFSPARHIGPMAQDFHAAFGLDGTDDKHIATVDADGAALAAIQGLNAKVEVRSQKSEYRMQKSIFTD
jgi:hypothetical protein